MQDESEIQHTYAKCAELTRVLVFAARGGVDSSARPPMEMLAMHNLDGRLVYAIFEATYWRISRRARNEALDLQAEQLWADIVRARTAISKAIDAMPSVCPRTRRHALMRAVMLNPILRRADVASQANVSAETAGRWLDRLTGRGLLRRVRAGNVAVYFVAPLILPVIRQLHLLQDRAVDANSLQKVFRTQVVIPMHPYRSGYWSTGDKIIRERRRWI